MHQNEYLKEHMKAMRELAAKPQPKRSQAEAYAQYDRLMRLSREEAIASIEKKEQLPGDE